jgi:hypothetical protein
MLILQIWGIDIYPKHLNMLMYEGVLGFIAVGIRNLSYDPAFVNVGEPDGRLTGDLLFVAKRMGLQCPPLPIAGHEEIRIFNEWMRTAGSQPSFSKWCELAEIYKQKTDCKKIFPKLPSMLKAYQNTWKKNRLIKMAQEKVKVPFMDLLKELGMKRTVPQNDATNERNPPQGQQSVREMPARDTQNRIVTTVSTYVPPVAAPNQRTYVPIPRVRTKQGKDKRVCANFCGRLASECGGVLAKNCTTMPMRSLEELEMYRREQRRRRCLHYAAERAARKLRPSDEEESK